MFKKEYDIKDLCADFGRKFNLSKVGTRELMKELERKGVIKINWHCPNGAKVTMVKPIIYKKA